MVMAPMVLGLGVAGGWAASTVEVDMQVVTIKAGSEAL